MQLRNLLGEGPVGVARAAVVAVRRATHRPVVRFQRLSRPTHAHRRHHRRHAHQRHLQCSYNHGFKHLGGFCCGEIQTHTGATTEDTLTSDTYNVVTTMVLNILGFLLCGQGRDTDTRGRYYRRHAHQRHLQCSYNHGFKHHPSCKTSWGIFFVVGGGGAEKTRQSR